MTKRAFVSALALAALAPAAAHAQVLITEVQVDPTSANDDGEWLEIQNTGMSAVMIGAWTINDYTGTTAGAESGTRWSFPAGTMLSAGQVIVIAKFAGAGAYADNTPAGLYAQPPTFELATAARDDMTIANLIPIGGTTLTAFSNAATGDAIVLRDELGNTVSTIEWGSVDRTVSGTPITGLTASAGSYKRIATTGDSSVDWEVAVTPDPFVGFTTSPGNQPPVISGTAEGSRHIAHGTTLTVTTTVADAEGVASVELFIASATSSAGPASGAYSAVAMAQGPGNSWSVEVSPSMGPPPATFHDLYFRSYVRATDTMTATTTDPANAEPSAANVAYRSRNIMPPTPSPIADVRAQSGSATSALSWRFHSATIEGVVLTRRIAFISNRTNFFVQSTTSNDAIRVFATPIIAEDVVPGDLVRVTGMIDTFNGLRQIGEPELAVQIIGTTTPVVPSPRTIADILANAEQLESQLVHVAGADFVNPQTNWPNNGNVDITDGTGTITVRVTSIVDLSGTPVPMGSFDIRGILGQFAASGVGGYQLLPRDRNDVLSPTPRPDAGPLDDAGEGEDGAMGDDSGMGSEDGGPGEDTGMMPGDTGMMMPGDTGMHMDGSEMMRDSGPKEDGTVTPNPDASEEDGGVVPRRDTGTGGGGGGREESGCSCSAAESRGEGAGAAFGLIFVLAFVAVRRR